MYKTYRQLLNDLLVEEKEVMTSGEEDTKASAHLAERDLSYFIKDLEMITSECKWLYYKLYRLQDTISRTRARLGLFAKRLPAEELELFKSILEEDIGSQESF